MALIQNDMGEFVDNFDPYETDRKSIYANCLVRGKVDMGDQGDERGEKECRGCHELFEPRHNKQLYCSEECKKNACKRRRVARGGR